jgi:photosystem II stability/assembly factor-like uncharacterized protein
MPSKQHHPKIEPWLKIGGPQTGSIAALAITGEKDYIVFIGTTAGLFRSSCQAGDSLLHWERLEGAPVGIICLGISPNYSEDHTLVVGTNAGIHYSHDAGYSWQAAQMPRSSSTILCFSFSPDFLIDGIIFAGTFEDGIFYSDTRGEKWENKNFGLLDPTIYAMAISPNFTYDGMIFAGTDTAVYYSYNHGRAWRQLDFPENATPVLSLAISPNFPENHTLFAGTEKNGIYYSLNQGSNWQKKEFPAESINVLMFSTNGANLYAATELGIFLSDDQGSHWQKVADFPVVISMALKDDMIIAGMVEQGVWWSRDGMKWEPITNLSVNAFVSLCISNQFETDQTAFLYGPQDGLWQTSDGGISWKSMSDSLPCLNINGVFLSPGFHIEQTLLATARSGAYISVDGGNDWRLLFDKPSNLASFSPDGRILSVSLPGGGILASENWLEPAEHRAWESVPGPWDSGGTVVAISVNNEHFYHVALVEGLSETVSIWQGKQDQLEKIISLPYIDSPVISFWVPEKPVTDKLWFMSIGNKVWKFSSRTGVRYTQTYVFATTNQKQQVLCLAGAVHQNGYSLFACTGKCLYKSNDAKTWNVAHDFLDERAISIALSPSYNDNKTVYALLLGGMLSKGLVR